MQWSGLMQVLDKAGDQGLSRSFQHLHHDGITPDIGQCIDSSLFTMLDILCSYRSVMLLVDC